MSVAVISKTGERLMPTSEYRARKLLKSGKAIKYSYHPFTIQLTERKTGNIQPIELCMDTGYIHIGISVKSEKHEYLTEQIDTLTDERSRHNARRMYRSQRRNRKRYRQPRFNNRKKDKRKFKPWIYKIVTNTSFEILKNTKNYLDIEEENIQAEKIDIETNLTLWETVQNLSQPYRTVITLFYYEDMSIKEISKITGNSTDTIKKQLSRGREKIKEVIKI